MTRGSDRPIAMLFGLLGAALLVLDGLFDIARGAVLLAIREGPRTFHPFAEGLIYVVLGAIVAFFAILGRSRWGDGSLAAGVVLTVLAVAGWFVLGFTQSTIALLASVLVLISGLLFLVAGRHGP